MSAQDNQLGIICHDSDETSVLFHFIHVDESGKEHHSPHYRATNVDCVYDWQIILADKWYTRQEVNQLRKGIRTASAATKV